MITRTFSLKLWTKIFSRYFCLNLKALLFIHKILYFSRYFYAKLWNFPSSANSVSVHYESKYESPKRYLPRVGTGGSCKSPGSHFAQGEILGKKGGSICLVPIFNKLIVIGFWSNVTYCISICTELWLYA